MIGFESSTEISAGVRNRLGDVRILTGQPVSFILVPNRILATPAAKFAATTSARDAARTAGGKAKPTELPEDDMLSRLGSVLAPYLASGYPPIELAAEIAGTSTRSLQRRLGELQITYTRLIDHVRYSRAVDLLRNSDLKVLDIALSLGYGDASNFTRAFRRIGGLSPSELRRQRELDGGTRSMARNDRKITARIV